MVAISGKYKLVNSDNILGEITAAYSPVLKPEDIARMAHNDNEKVMAFQETDNGVIVTVEYRQAQAHHVIDSLKCS
jgi:hypothetical protein